MIILRQHNYTFGDKKVIDEVLKATDRLKYIPKGWRNLTTRDAYRLEDLNNAIYHGKPVNQRDVKELATHLGLPETAEHGKHFIDKFSNPKLIERWKKYKAHKLGVNKDINELKELTKAKDDLLYHGSDKEFEAFMDKNREKLYELEKKINDQGLNTVIHNTRFFIISPEDKRYYNYLKGLHHKVTQEKEPIGRGKELIAKLREDQSKRGIKIRHKANLGSSHADYINGEITMARGSQSQSPAVNFHEDGHLVWENRTAKRLKMPIEDAAEYKGMTGFLEPRNQLAVASAEVGADVAGLSRAKKLGATPKELSLMKEHVAKAYGTYFPSIVENLPGNKRLNLV